VILWLPIAAPFTLKLPVIFTSPATCSKPFPVTVVDEPINTTPPEGCNHNVPEAIDVP
jgi:hypothetical protein